MKLATELYVTGTGQELEVHERTDDCLTYGCVIHNPSDHAMRDFPTHWRDDRRLMERICPHGVGHPDPDSIAFALRKTRERGERFNIEDGIHGCDGCCRAFA